jgi:hypothetical protein
MGGFVAMDKLLEMVRVLEGAESGEDHQLSGYQPFPASKGGNW